MKNGVHGISIELKITILVCAAALVFFAAVIGLGYVSLANSLIDTAGAGYAKIADALSSSITGIIDRQTGSVGILMNNAAIKAAIAASNSRSRRDEKDSQRYLMDMDKKWIEAPDDHPLVKEYLDSEASRELRSEIRNEKDFIEILVTDRAGGLVASSARVHDFYQANKDWWQEAFNAGKGKALVKDIAFNEAFGVWVIPFVVPVRDADGEVAGICKAMVDIRAFFGPLKDFKIGKTGTAALVDDNSYLVFQRETKPFTYKFCESGKFQNVLRNKHRWSVADSVYLYPGKALLAYSPVSNPIFLDGNISWRVFIVQGLRETLSPLNIFVFQILVITILAMISILAAAKTVFKGLFTDPMRKLRDGIDRISRGELDYRLKIKSGDEIEELADSFNALAGNLKSSVSPIAVLNTETIERKKIEAELARTTEEWQRVFNAFTDIVFITDANFNILKVNAAFLESVRLLKAEDVIGRKCFEIFHGNDKPFPKCPVNHNILKDKGIYTEETSDANTGRAALYTVMPIVNQHEELILIIHIVKDISDIRRVRQDIAVKDKELQGLEKLKKDFLYMMSQYQAVLSEDEQGMKSVLYASPNALTDRQKKRIADAVADMDRLIKGIEDLLEIVSIEQGEADFKMEPVDLRSLVKKVVFGFEPKIKAKGLELKLAVPLEKVMVYADANRINRVFVNLLENAAKFTEKGSIEIAVTELRDDAECRITDTGMGIMQDDLPRVFDRFQKINTAELDTETAGLGLGLAMVKSIIERHKGKIWVESTPGKGSKFTFILPKHKKEPPQIS